MSDQSSVPPQSPPNPNDYPSPSLPVAFADGVASINWSGGVAKIYLLRFDPHLRAGGPTAPQTVAQVVMPIRGFVHCALFFQRCVDQMLKDGTISQEVIDTAQKTERDDNA